MTFRSSLLASSSFLIMKGGADKEEKCLFAVCNEERGKSNTKGNRRFKKPLKGGKVIMKIKKLIIATVLVSAISFSTGLITAYAGYEMSYSSYPHANGVQYEFLADIYSAEDGSYYVVAWGNARPLNTSVGEEWIIFQPIILDIDGSYFTWGSVYWNEPLSAYQWCWGGVEDWISYTWYPYYRGYADGYFYNGYLHDWHGTYHTNAVFVG